MTIISLREQAMRQVIEGALQHECAVFPDDLAAKITEALVLIDGDEPASPKGGTSNAASRHTPGPWTWERHNDEDRRYHSSDWRLAPGILLPDTESGTPGGDEIDRANARLIAAAPDLLEALRLAEILYREGILGVPDGFWDKVHNARRAAIAKAEGRSQ
jgi:hypothetical protein